MLEHIKQNQYVYFSIVAHHPSGGYLSATDTQPTYTVRKKVGNTITNLISNYDMQTSSVPGLYDGYFYTSGNIFSNGDYCEVYASGKVSGLSDVIIAKSFKVGDIFDGNLVQVSGNDINYNDFASNIYYCNVKYIKDNANNRDEYTVNWLKNSRPLTSGNITNPALSVYRTNDGVAVFQNQTLSFANNTLGILRYNGSNTIVSGEAYLARTSGTIDGSNRTWEYLFGLDAL